MVFSLLGRCQGEWGSAKNTRVPVSRANRAWPDSSLPRSQVRVLRSGSGSVVMEAVSAAFTGAMLGDVGQPQLVRSGGGEVPLDEVVAVSYTHLTLPTNREV